MPLSGKEIVVEEGVLSLLLFVPRFMEEFAVAGAGNRPGASACDSAAPAIRLYVVNV
jgi:hypothetical protein